MRYTGSKYILRFCCRKTECTLYTCIITYIILEENSFVSYRGNRSDSL